MNNRNLSSRNLLPAWRLSSRSLPGPLFCRTPEFIWNAVAKRHAEDLNPVATSCIRAWTSQSDRTEGLTEIESQVHEHAYLKENTEVWGRFQSWFLEGNKAQHLSSTTGPTKSIERTGASRRGAGSPKPPCQSVPLTFPSWNEIGCGREENYPPICRDQVTVLSINPIVQCSQFQWPP